MKKNNVSSVKSVEKTLRVAIPVMREYENIPALIKILHAQSCRRFHVYFCINQPDLWWDDKNHVQTCLDNRKTFEYIQRNAQFAYSVIDKFSKGNAWGEKKKGVGWARKLLYEKILEEADENDIIISLDADTQFRPGYFQTVLNVFLQHPGAHALAVPYRHLLTGDAELDRAMLRYEIYLRTYLLGLFLIQSPYAFTAIGSAMAFPVWAYRKIGGMKAYESGEDFYLLQKLRKAGNIIQCLDEQVFPSARISDRVPFGTGPAMQSGIRGDWTKYPVFSFRSFQKIKAFYAILPELYIRRVPTPLDDFFMFQFGNSNIWDGIRNHSTSVEQFIKKAHQKIDGLRILQFLRYDHSKSPATDEQNLRTFLPFIPEGKRSLFERLSFRETSVSILEEVRNTLLQLENQFRCQQPGL